MRSSNFDKYPATRIDGKLIMGWETIVNRLQDEWGDSPVWAIDLYVGSYEEDFVEAFSATGREVVQTRSLMIGDEAVKELTDRFITDDVLFGYMSDFRLEEYFCEKKVEEARSRLADGGKYVVIGTAAARIAPSAPVAYADMARWEIQQRFRDHLIAFISLGIFLTDHIIRGFIGTTNVHAAELVQIPMQLQDHAGFHGDILVALMDGSQHITITGNFVLVAVSRFRFLLHQSLNTFIRCINTLNFI